MASRKTSTDATATRGQGEAGGEQAPRECTACRGTGSVISHLGGQERTLQCPWCEGSGRRVQGIDAQAHWRASEDEASLAGQGSPDGSAASSDGGGS